MNLEETIKCANDMATKKYTEAMLCHANPDDEELDGLIDCALNHEQLAKWLGELKELKEYKEKYRWHDLRKNPDDLPEDIKYVWVFIKGECTHRSWHDSHGWRRRNSNILYYNDESSFLQLPHIFTDRIFPAAIFIKNNLVQFILTPYPLTLYEKVITLSMLKSYLNTISSHLICRHLGGKKALIMRVSGHRKEGAV